MPEVVVRKRVGRRRRSWKDRLEQWYARNRPRAVVLMAASIACGLGLVVAAGAVMIAGHGPSNQPDEVPISAP